MLSITDVSPAPLERFAGQLLRLSMVVIFFWFGLQKFTAYEVMGIVPFISNSPLTSWPNVLGTQGASMVIGVSELAFGLLLAIGFCWPGSLGAILGAIGSCVAFLTTLSFLLTTPAVFAAGAALVMSPDGLFLVKDVVLLAISVTLLAKSRTDTGFRGRAPRPVGAT